MFCKKCGKKIPDDSVFCKHCGCNVEDFEDDSEDIANEKNTLLQEPSADREDSEADDIDLEAIGKAVTQKLATVSAQVGATAKTKIKAMVEESISKVDASTSGKKTNSAKKATEDKSELALIVIFGLVAVLFLVLVIIVAINRHDGSPSEPDQTPIVSVDESEPEVDPNAPRHTARLLVEFDSNWFFDTYDAEVSIDGKSLGTQPHGEDSSYEIELANGEHTFSVKDTEGAGRAGSMTFDATDLTVVGFNIDIGTDQIYIERLDTVSAPLGPDEVAGKSRQEVGDAFRNAGFEDVKIEELDDLPLDQTGDTDKVASVAVKGFDSFAAGDVFFPNEQVVIRVHTPAKIKAPVSSSALLGMNYEEARAQLEEAGFTVECLPASSYNADYGDWEVKEVAVNVLFASDNFKEGAEFDYGTTIKLYYNEMQPRNESKEDAGVDEWDLEWAARKDFETYGGILYPYGFKCHWFMDLVTCEPQGDGTYFIKVGVTITNEYGTKRDTYAQGIAGNGNVRDFWVS